MRIIWADEAREDRRELIRYVQAESIINAIELDDRVDEAVERLGIFPLSGRSGLVTGTRELVVTHTPYLAVYTATETEVTILRLIHGAQRWPEED